MGVGFITLSDEDQNDVLTSHESRFQMQQEPGFFEGAASSIPSGVVHGFDVGMAALTDTGNPIGELLDKSGNNFSTQFRNRMIESRADPKTMGTLAQIGHSLGTIGGAGVAGGLIAGPIGAIGGIGGIAGYDAYSELRDQGVDKDTATKAASITGAVNAIGGGLPAFFGKTLTTKLATGMGVNVALGIGERASNAEILRNAGYAEIAEHYKALDSTSLATDLILGAAFPFIHSLSGKLGSSRADRFVPTEAVDTALRGEEGVAQRVRDPVLQTDIETLDRKMAAEDEFSRQVLIEGKAPQDVRIDDEFINTDVPKVPPIVRFRQIAQEVENNLPPIPDGYIRLWRGNRPGEVGKNPQFTNDLPGIALPFQKAYGGDLSYVDVPAKDSSNFINKGVAADDAEFILPLELAKNAIAVDSNIIKNFNGVTTRAIQNPEFVKSVKDTVDTFKESFNETGGSLKTVMKSLNEYADFESKKVKDNSQIKDAPEFVNTETQPLPEDFAYHAAIERLNKEGDVKITDELGNEVSAKEVIQKAQFEVEQSKKESQLYKVAVSCAIGSGQ